MSIHRTTFIATAFCTAFLPMEALFGQGCRPEDTVAECFSSGVPELASMRVEVDEKPTGAAEPAGANPTAIADYLPRLAAALIAPGLTDDLPGLAFSTNLPLNDGVLLDLGGTLQFGLRLNQPEVFPALIDTVPEALRAAVKERLEAEFDEFSDPLITASFNFENSLLGRSLRQHADELSGLLNVLYDEAALLAGTSGGEAEALIGLHELAGNFQASVRPELRSDTQCSRAQLGIIPLRCFAPEYRQRLERQIVAAAAEFRASHVALRQQIAVAGVNRVGDLINNQPQINTAFEWHPRESGAGPSEFTLRLRGEWSPANLNGARRFCRKKSPNRNAPLSANCLGQYLADPGIQRSLRRGERFWLAVDLARQETYRAPLLPADSASLRLPAFWRLQPSLGFGWYVSAPETGPQRARIDVQVSGSFQDTDGVRTPTRYLASATYSLRLGDDVVGSAGLLWANKPEFLGDDVTRVGARFGVRYKLPSTR